MGEGFGKIPASAIGGEDEGKLSLGFPFNEIGDDPFLLSL
jgi:hypothetical protein